jgi:hypothetical protein
MDGGLGGGVDGATDGEETALADAAATLAPATGRGLADGDEPGLAGIAGALL